MKRKHVWLPVVALALVLLPFGPVAQPGPRSGEGAGPGKGRPPHRMWMELNLTAEQKEQLKALREEMQPIREKHMESVKAVRDKIKAELLKSDPSQNTLYGYAGELGELHKQMTKDRTDHLLKVKKILTPEQFSKLVEREEKMDHGKGFGHRGGKHPHKGDECPHKGGVTDIEE
jgi:Spy/CpxP family protein refolding chaperone